MSSNPKNNVDHPLTTSLLEEMWEKGRVQRKEFGIAPGPAWNELDSEMMNSITDIGRLVVKLCRDDFRQSLQPLKDRRML